MEPILDFQNVTKSYGKKKALDSINLTIPHGKIVGLLGPNGSGKTTLIKLTAGLLTPTKGKVSILGTKPGADSKKIVSYQPDHVFLNDWMKVKHLLKFMKDFFKDFNEERAREMLEHLNIKPDDKLKTMSKGTKEKVQLITTMSRDAELYLLDEPIGGVDPAARDYILNTILANHKPGSTVVISTHLITDIEQVLEHVVFIKNGNILRNDSADTIREQTGKSIDALFREEFKCD
ncbi:ABC transporter ATP-binding protein [Treponema sp.]|uniref:ABC transporter ATP-binding protein n=1 Tax=Treponema sp. TaxID=166 RepID=UPI00298DA96B|nr:ABC transporter ATP-binding protein [Treponema sp.]